MSKNSGVAFVGILIIVTTLIGIITSLVLISRNKNTEVTTSPDFSVATNPDGPHFGDFLHLTTPTTTPLASIPTLTPSVTPTILSHITSTPTTTPTSTLSPSPSPTPSRTPTFTPTPTLRPTSTPTLKPTTTPTVTPTPASPNKTTATYSPKAFLLIFNPILKTKNNTRLISFKGWFNPTDLANQYVPIIRDNSHNIINYGVVEIKEVDDIPLKQDGFKYTEDSYLACLNNTGPCHNQPWTADYVNYNKILDDNQICQKVNNNQIDELWMFGGPWMGFYEANMAGPNSFDTNGPVISGTSCQKPLHIMGFSYERGVSEMVHDLGHRIEGTMTNFLPGQVWNQFKLNSNCGEIHYPPNTTNAYIYNDGSSVNSRCDDWYNYPNLKNVANNINCQVWGCSDLGFYKWWIQHLSYSAGTDGYGKNLNWWSYITNANPN